MFISRFPEFLKRENFNIFNWLAPYKDVVLEIPEYLFYCYLFTHFLYLDQIGCHKLIVTTG